MSGKRCNPTVGTVRSARLEHAITLHEDKDEGDTASVEEVPIGNIEASGAEQITENE
jgi:hypothetical protein